MPVHIPVLADTIISLFENLPQKNICDCTIGEAGHSKTILEKFEDAFILGIDKDNQILKIAQKNLQIFSDRIKLICDSFKNIDKILKSNKIQIYGFLLDLGISNFHLKHSERGFSFLKDQPLDMRFDIGTSITAYEIINSYTYTELVNIFSELGNDRLSVPITKEIIQIRKKRKIRTTFELKNIVHSIYRKYKLKSKIDPATKIFQALRIFVNSELKELEECLSKILNFLPKNGIIIAISYHSGEDRIVKNIFKQNKTNYKILTKKPIRPTKYEILNNPSARSSKLRVITKI